MCCFYTVIKFLMLKILLADLAGLSTALRYGYGYHPSAEEYDTLLSETQRTWTHAFLKAERDRLFMKPAESRQYETLENRANFEARYFVPKFQYENNQSKNIKKFKQNRLKNSNSQITSSSKELKPLQNIGSSLDFNYYSDELPKPMTSLHLDIPIPIAVSKPVTSALPEINSKPFAKPDFLNFHDYSLNDRYGNDSQSRFPIYFTNPATGIVYAITELGKSAENVTKTNGTIPIFIAKEQYERDVLKLKEEYKRKCKNSQTNTATRPQIIRLQKPLSPNSAVVMSGTSAVSAIASPIKKPLPVVIKTELIVKDKKPSTVTRPLRKNKKKTKPKPKLKIKKQNAPGHKTRSNNDKPILPNQAQGPVIIKGSRTNTEILYEKMSKQLEKPNFDNVFSNSAAPQTSNTNRAEAANHRINKRSLNKQSDPENLLTKFVSKRNLEHFVLAKSVKKIWNKSLENHLRTSPAQYFQNNESLPDLLLSASKKLSNSLAMNKENFKKSTKSSKDINRENIVLNKKEIETNFTAANEEHPSKTPQFAVFNTNQSKNNFENLTLRKVLKTINISNNNQSQNLNSARTESSLNISSDQQLFESSSASKILRSNEANPNNLKLQNTLVTIKNSTNGSMKHQIVKRSTEEFTEKNSNSTKLLETSNEIQNFTTNHNTNHKTTAEKHEFKLENQSSGQQINTQTNMRQSINSRETTINQNRSNFKLGADKKKTLKHSKKRQRFSAHTKTTPRTIKPGIRNQPGQNNKMAKNSEGEQDTEYYFFDMGDNYDEDEEEDADYEDDDDYDEGKEEDEDEDEEEVNNYKEQYAVPINDDQSHQTHTDEVEYLKPDNSKSPQKASENSASEIKPVDFKSPEKTDSKTKYTYMKKRIRRRPPHLKINDDYEDDDDDDDEEGIGISSNVNGFFRMLFYPLQVAMSTVMDSFGGKVADEDNDNNEPSTQYTSYHNTLKQHSSDEYDEDYDDSIESSDSSLSSWFSSWFTLNRRNKKIGSTTPAPNRFKPTKTSNSWLPSWLGFGANDRISTESVNTEDYDEYDKWFASWFGKIKPKARKKTTTTSTTTQLPLIPILTILDPMKNPQNWMGILAHHIINHTSTSTGNPFRGIPITTTENPEIPRKMSYDKYQIWRLKPQDDSQVKALEEYRKSEDGIKLQWLKGPSLRGLTDVLVPPKMLVDFQASLTFELIDHEVLIFDVGKAIAYEKTKEDYFFATTQKAKRHDNKNTTPIKGMTWHKYYKYDDIMNYLESMRMRFPYLVELIHIGRSYEGRPLIVMKIESKEAAEVNSAHYPAHQRNKLRHKKRIGLANAVFIEAGTHGMEWIGPATATWIINELLRIMKKNVTDDQSFIRNTTWYIMPVLNPDGYVYSFEFDRFWKKSRSRQISRPSGILNSAMTWLQKKRSKEKICFGVDLDRNWHYQWGRRGSSKTVCNELYAGPTPFSEPETKALSEFLMDYRMQIKLFVSMQAYGQIISYPYKANTTYDSERLDDLLDVAMVGADGLRRKGSKSRYKIDSSNDLVENRSGSSDAFAAYEVGIPFSYTLHLADNGVHGYLLPSASIEPTAKDSFEIITGMLDYI